jgi:hypothetical protein
LGAFKQVIGFGSAETSGVVQMVQSYDSTTAQPLLYMTFEIPAGAIHLGGGVADNCENIGFKLMFDTGTGAQPYREIEVLPWGVVPNTHCNLEPPSGSTLPGQVGSPGGAFGNYNVGTFNAATPGQIDWSPSGTLPPLLSVAYGVTLNPVAGCLTSYGAVPGATDYVHFELRIPMNDLGLPSSGFGMAWALFTQHNLPSQFGGGSAYSEFTWPSQCTVTGGTPTGDCTQPGAACAGSACPTPDTWGKVKVDWSTCQGLSITQISVSNQLTAAGAPNTDIEFDGGNIFHTMVQNTGVDAAVGVQADYRIANFGTQFGTQPWLELPPSVGNPTGPATINPGTTVDLATTSGWTPDPSMYYNADASPYGQGHQCMLVQLSSTSNATFASASSYTNMNIVNMSAFQDIAVIDMRDVSPTFRKLAYEVAPITQYAYGDGSNPGLPAGHVSARVNWYFTPFVATGIHDPTGGKPELVLPGPSFGYVTDHDMGDAFQKPFTARHQDLWDQLECKAPNLNLKSRAGAKPPPPGKPKPAPKPGKAPMGPGSLISPVFSPTGTTQTSDFMVALASNAGGGTTLCYTVNGAAPTCSINSDGAWCDQTSNTYESPIPISAQTADSKGQVTIQAIACRRGSVTTPVVSQTYTRCLFPPDPRFYDALNKLLEGDKERPAATDFQLRVDGLTPAPGGPQWPHYYSITVPPDGVALLAATGGYGDAALPPPPPLDGGLPGQKGSGGGGVDGGEPDGGQCGVPGVKCCRGGCCCDVVGTAWNGMAAAGAAFGSLGALGAAIWRRRRRGKTSSGRQS